MGEIILKLTDINLQMENFELSNITLDLFHNEVHIIMGENRSGKSLLMKIIGGMIPPDSGTVHLDGEEYNYRNYANKSRNDAIYIRQNADMITNLSIAENLFFNNLPYKNKLLKEIDYDKLNFMCQKLVDELNLPINIYDKVSTLGLAQRQIIEFCRAYVSKAKIVILDEPFAALTVNEREVLYRIVNSIKSKGAGIFYITHRLEDVFLLGDRITIIKGGLIIDTKYVKDCTEEEIIKMLSGRSLNRGYPKIHTQKGRVVLSVRNLSFEDKLENINFDLRRGEIFGITGLAGSGRTLLASCLFGAVRDVGGNIYLNGHEVKITDPSMAISSGIALIPENRITDSIFSYLDIHDNVSVSALNRFARALTINIPILKQVVTEYIDKLQISQDLKDSILEYSGGEQQKAVFAKWIMSRAKIFILDEPTRGLDIGSKIDIYNYINDLVKKDASIIFISSDIEEILGICDRVAVLSTRTFVCNVPTKDITVEKVIKLATKEEMQFHDN